MTIAATLKAYLDQRAAVYEVITHPPAASSLRTAEAAHLSGHRVAKAVVVGDEQGHLVVVVPSPYLVELGLLHRQLGRRLGLATEPELAHLFPDCESGAVPAIGEAYGLETLWDRALWEEPELFLEGGDHQTLLRIRQAELQKVLGPVRTGQFSHPQ
ncbi:MAG TPA: YbaK/EbsC family protein [Candidatus Competibacteraceae bacterium]|nr:YbaK/EbsC family protein [Candidatus Competibacteraceae bacterium]